MMVVTPLEQSGVPLCSTPPESEPECPSDPAPYAFLDSRKLHDALGKPPPRSSRSARLTRNKKPADLHRFSGLFRAATKITRCRTLSSPDRSLQPPDSCGWFLPVCRSFRTGH
ncbi:hypothetical protein FCH79_06230 [Pseudomonas koreensis]|nr:hypothetical protein [Pseudomonas koreensis]